MAHPWLAGLCVFCAFIGAIVIIVVIWHVITFIWSCIFDRTPDVNIKASERKRISVKIISPEKDTLQVIDVFADTVRFNEADGACPAFWSCNLTNHSFTSYMESPSNIQRHVVEVFTLCNGWMPPSAEALAHASD